MQQQVDLEPETAHARLGVLQGDSKEKRKENPQVFRPMSLLEARIKERDLRPGGGWERAAGVIITFMIIKLLI